MSRLLVRLRECLDLHEARTGERLTYEELAKRTKLSRATIESLATRADYNATLRTIERVCKVLGVTHAELLEWRREICIEARWYWAPCQTLAMPRAS